METVPLFYQSIINDVIAKCYSKTENNADILENLRQLWLRKLITQADNFVELDSSFTENETPVTRKRKRLIKIETKSSSFYCDELLTPCKRNMPDITAYSIIPNILKVENNKGIKQESLANFIKEKKKSNCFVLPNNTSTKIHPSKLLKKKVGRKKLKKAQHPLNKLIPKKTIPPNNAQAKNIDRGLKRNRKRCNLQNSTPRTNTLLKSNAKSKKNKTNKKSTSTNKANKPKKCDRYDTVQNTTQESTSILQQPPRSKVILKREPIDTSNSKVRISPLQKEKYNYIYKNNQSQARNLFKYKRVKIILPHRIGYTIHQRTCIIKVPVWSLQGTRLPTIVTPLIKQVSDLSTLDATLFLQDYVNNHINMLQVDGSGVKINFKSNLNVGYASVLKEIDDTSDVNSDDDGTDDENPNTAFESKNQIMCQFNIIKHNKHKWWIELKNGIMCLNGKEYLFNAAKGVTYW